MSRETSPKDSQSESSNSSPNPPVMKSQKDLTDLTLFGGPVSLRLNRSATVRRASTLSAKKEPVTIDDYIFPVVVPSEKHRNSKLLDSNYRRSLESISEYRPKSSFSMSAFYPSRNGGSSLDSTSSDCTDYAFKSTTETYNTKDNDKTFTSPSSSYLSWIESVNSEYFGNTGSTADIVDVDNKVGEWNNFWLNYNSPRNRYLSSYYLCPGNEDKTGDDVSDCKSSCSTQKEFNEKLSGDNVIITYDDINEILRCSQRITEILQKVVRKNEEIDQSNDSYYSQYYSQPTTYDEDLTRDRNLAYAADSKDSQKQQQLLKPSTQTNSCINVLLNTGVADILKRVISKRREVVAPEEISSTSRSSFCDWSSGK